METIIRPSADLRNHYNEISKLVRESRKAVILTVNGRGDTAILSLQEFNQMSAELELLRTLAEAEDDVKNGRIEPIENVFKDLRAELLERNNR
ncbi:type II toxin-antitoxin system prevent-host-death family antitoxin [Acidaminobacter sp.]|uniref:type II toxin-antitoxin system prevent-host-death family antitoxin n=1 Tax=Acidaminobacter sp. TaxID=1872102 RepID=UPI001384122C|nr:type II toxin-antitoxin system prevent-host-death family antitoxin [Acidaminobacter sp.]MDK9711474.1 type II toxin-antitoxin system Phd/YefM family antitoxin [Acidaminobacter sp.]MZQ96961.1 type II toxin-antitoxin system prevent-host-death family antitoxin [Acidaminobacter sp.]